LRASDTIQLDATIDNEGFMDLQDAKSLLQEVIDRERKDGCPMAHESLIEPVLRRWRSYARRNQRNKDKSLKHRARDLEKCLIALYPDHRFDPGCIRHLAESFADILFTGNPPRTMNPLHNSIPSSFGHSIGIQQPITNAEIEMRWVDAWSELYELLKTLNDGHCQLPDGSVLDTEQCKAWLQESVYEGYLVKVELLRNGQQDCVAVSRSLPES
jgi:hypothetical protein